VSPIVRAVTIIPNIEKERALPTTLQLVDWLQNRGIGVSLSHEVATLIARPELAADDPDLFRSVDLAIVLGGDGTLLDVAIRTADCSVPLLGVNLGHLGFLTELELPELFAALPDILAGSSRIETRMMIEAEVTRHDGATERFLALNEATIHAGPCRMIEVDVHIGANLAATYPGDGLIIATPTGSTAYALSAGGPIVSPDLDVIAIVPVCPHQLASRALVVSPEEAVHLGFRADHDDIWLALDGHNSCRLTRGDEVLIRRATAVTRLVRRVGWSFYDVLRRKLTGEMGR
jgi:NAD+ kinase